MIEDVKPLCGASQRACVDRCKGRRTEGGRRWSSRGASCGKPESGLAMISKGSNELMRGCLFVRKIAYSR